ncbi:MAG: dihydrolipoyl dehydrogenase [Deltaproteobacteria bacterium]|jgi:dihydrolipoamide dehydrogenase|nr:dihydrolipoyl dehydrogenase [Deltaproteobacteria bacterium]
MADEFDLIVIGGGPGGYVAAIRAAQLGSRVAVVEKRSTLGGTCLIEGCIPSKALLDSSEYFALAHHEFAKHGILMDSPKLDLAKMMKRKDDLIMRLTRGVASLFKKHQIELFRGTGRLAAHAKTSTTVIVEGDTGEQRLQGEKILLATGSVPVEIPGISFDATGIGHARHALEYQQVPDHLLVIGGGYIGLELGSVWKRLGAKVTVVEMLDDLLPNTDREVATTLLKSLEKQGLDIHSGTKVTAVEESSDGLRVRLEGKTDLSVDCDQILVAAGRKPCTEGLGLEQLGIALDDSGRIVVDENYATSRSGVYAIGDLIHGPMLAHKAMDEAVVCVERLAGTSPEVNYNLIPGIVYTMPEVAAVGATEEQLKQQGTAYQSGKFPFMASGRAKALGETEGFVKVLAAAKSGRLLGVHILGPRASELIAEAVSLMACEASVEDVALIMHPHPTLSEAFKEASLACIGSAIHA